MLNETVGTTGASSVKVKGRSVGLHICGMPSSPPPVCPPSDPKDYGPSKHHATPYNTPTFNGDYAEFTAANSEYILMPNSFAAVFAVTTSFTSTFWVYLKTESQNQR